MSPRDISDDKVTPVPETDGSDNAAHTHMADLKVALVEDNAHLTVRDILRGTGAHQLTPFERKAALINA